jgi:crotonobetainyl-CoA:carnitine CoA-transferase CaiB-like acyl-CoA transferase
MANAPLRHVLDGYKILDLSQHVAGPTCTLMLAEMGAEVIKVELMPNGDPGRPWPWLKDGRSGYFVQHNRGKKGICVDVKTPEGREIIAGLIPKCDVLVENFSPGTIRHMGFDYQQVKALNPEIVMCSISAFGQTGPLAHEPGFDFLGAAYSGITSMGGEANGSPYFTMAAIGDVSTGAEACGAICAALLYRERTGEGQYLDLSLLDTYFHYHEGAVEMYSLSGGELKPTRSGRHNWYAAPIGVFKGKNRYFMIMAAADHHFRALCEAMGKPGLFEDPRFRLNGDRLKNLDALVAEIEGWLASMPSDEAADAALREHRVPHAPVLSVEEAVKHPHLRQRGTVRTVQDRVLGAFDVPGFAFRFSRFPKPLELHAPFLGEHNEQILTEDLGYSPARVRELEEKGILKSGPA